MTKRIRSPLLFATMLASVLTTVGAGAIAFGDNPLPAPSIRDVRIGERGMQTRIVIFCDGECLPEARGEGEFFLNYFLKGAGDSFTLDLSGASDRVLTMTARRDAAGSSLAVVHDGALERSTVKPCTVGGRAAACLDLFFAAPQERVVAAAPAPETITADKGPAVPEDNGKATQKEEKPSLNTPRLRETASDRFEHFAKLAPPERLDPPPPPILAKVQPIEPAVAVATPSLRTSGSLTEPVEADFSSRIMALLGKNLTPAYCNNAEATLQTDAWALGAMVDLGLCAAARGDVVEAESMLSRLLEYTPDNYEALVGRALIAEQAGEKGAALRYYQDALDAAPPIEESARIVEAMAALS